jgi:uncharacterized protein YecE (DUF72 family)
VGIYIGLTGWGDHPSLYENFSPGISKLYAYASHFPIVEVDTAFYAIQPAKNYEKWVMETPDSFSFIVKAYQTLTGHDRQKMTMEEYKQLLDSYVESLSPVIEANKLYAILCQFPPWFQINKENVNLLRFIRDHIHSLPIALEFRNRTWFHPNYKEKTIQFMKDENWIHSICDEPQAGEGSIPTIFEPTHDEKTIIRFHGRNVAGWNKNGNSNWRAVRFLYRYNQEELTEWAKWINELHKKTKNIAIVFNNNSGGDAADNAKQLIQLLHLEYKGLNPLQLDLFS